MANTDTRVEDLLNSAVGCHFLVTLVESDLSPEVLADPKVSLSLAASSEYFMDIYHHDEHVHRRITAELSSLAREKAAQARAIIEHPGTAWWFEDIDLNAQTWVSLHWTSPPLKFIYDTTPPDTTGWKRPRNPSSDWERYAQKPNSSQVTSTLYGPHLTSELVAYDERLGDYMCEFPLAWWSVRFLEEVKVFEIHGSADWHELCVRYPAKYEGRLVPNWGAVAEEWDGVHLSFGGCLAAEQNRHESAAGWSMLDFWHAEQTYWLRALKTEPERQPDFQEGMGPPEVEGVRYPDIDGDSGTLLTRDGPFR